MARNFSLQSGDSILIENRILDLTGAIADAREVKSRKLRASIKSMKDELIRLRLVQQEEDDEE